MMSPQTGWAHAVGGQAIHAAVTPAEQIDYLDIWTSIALGAGLLVALVCLIAGLRGRPPSGVTIVAMLLLQLVLIGYALRYGVAQFSGESPVGPAWELWAYLVTVVMLPAIGLAWANEEHSRWGTLVLAVTAVVAAVMCGRVAQIWYGVGVA
ncbi:MAG: hypothetical protein WBG57_04645 [Ornithinimicrobium sp.]